MSAKGKNSIREINECDPRFQKYLNSVFDKVFVSGQVVWWMALYDPALEGWDGESVKCFADDFQKNVVEIAGELESVGAAVKLAAFMDDTGVDIVEASKRITKQDKIRMCESFWKKNNLALQLYALEESDAAIREALLVGAYTLIKDFKFAAWNVENCVESFVAASTAYTHGLNDKKIIAWLESEGLPVITVNEPDQAADKEESWTISMRNS